MFKLEWKYKCEKPIQWFGIRNYIAIESVKINYVLKIILYYVDSELFFCNYDQMS